MRASGFGLYFVFQLLVRDFRLCRAVTFSFVTQIVNPMKISLLIGALFALTLTLTLTLSQVHAQAPALADVWGKSPPASDDRFSNPKSKLYAGPDGYSNSGEVRANTGGKPYQFNGTFRLISKQTMAVKDLQSLLFNFGIDTQPAPGVYKITGKGNAALKTVKLSFADVSNSRILEWSSGDGAGTLTVTSVNGFLYVTTRNVALQPSGMSNKGEWTKPMTLGFEGAMKIE